jgi:Spy/CpxP family protein refolding chaperone
MGCQNHRRNSRSYRIISNASLVGVTLGVVGLSSVVAPAVLGQTGGAASKDALAIYREAGINQDQENQIREYVKGFETANSARVEKIRSLLGEMRSLSLTPSPDEAAVMAKQAEINTAQAEIANERIKLLLKIRSALTKDQRQKLVDLMQKGGAQAQ